MKNNNLLALFAIITLVFSSCSSEDDSLLIENQQEGLLKKYTLKRDATGAYSIDFNVTNNTQVDDIVDVENNLNQFVLSSSDTKSNKNISRDLFIDNSQIKVGVVDAILDKKSFITVIDDVVSLQRKSNSSKLRGCSVQSNEDGTYRLDFGVNDNVDVSFVFNEEINTYEVHLEKGKGGENSFSRILEKEEGKALKIDFVNHFNDNVSAKSYSSVAPRKPRFIIL